MYVTPATQQASASVRAATRRQQVRPSASAALTCALLANVVGRAAAGLPPHAARDPSDASEADRVLREVRAEIRSEAAAAENWRRRLAAGEPGVEPLPKRGLSPRPHAERVAFRYGAPPRRSPQRYADDAASPATGRRLQEDVLTVNNTAPIRIHLNVDTLDEEKVQANPLTRDRYCFKKGHWFRIGHPTTPLPTGPGPDDCERKTRSDIEGQNIWCICTEEDAITPEMKNLAIQATTEALAEIPRYLRVRPVQGRMLLTKSEGSFPALWRRTNQEGAYCDADCLKDNSIIHYLIRYII